MNDFTDCEIMCAYMAPHSKQYRRTAPLNSLVKSMETCNICLYLSLVMIKSQFMKTCTSQDRCCWKPFPSIFKVIICSNAFIQSTVAIYEVVKLQDINFALLWTTPNKWNLIFLKY